MDFNIEILKTKFSNWISIFLQNNFIPNPRQISKFEPDVFTSVHFSKLEKLRYKIRNNFETDDIVFVFFIFQNNFNRISIDVTFALEAHGPHHSPELQFLQYPLIKLFKKSDIFSCTLMLYTAAM